MADAVRCEFCSAHADRPGGSNFFGDPYRPARLPDGWLRVMVGSVSGEEMAATTDAISAECCSWPCAASWLSARAVEKEAHRWRLIDPKVEV